MSGGREAGLRVTGGTGVLFERMDCDVSGAATGQASSRGSFVDAKPGHRDALPCEADGNAGLYGAERVGVRAYFNYPDDTGLIFGAVSGRRACVAVDGSAADPGRPE